MDNIEYPNERPVFIMARMNPKGRVRFVSVLKGLGVKAYEVPSVRAAEDSARHAFAVQSIPVLTLDNRTIELKQSWFDYVILD